MERMILEVMKKGGCFNNNHPYITMINTLKNEGYVMKKGIWVHEGSGETFSDALMAYLHYAKKSSSAYVPSAQEVRDSNEYVEGLRW